MIAGCSTHIAGRLGGRATVLVAAMAAFSVATLGFATDTSAAGNALRLETPSGASASTYLAGYQATPSYGLASASVTFTVPTITCTATDSADSAILNNGVYTDNLYTEAFVYDYCPPSGPPVYRVQVQTPSSSLIYIGPAAGDVVVASLFQSGTSTVAEIHDLTAHLNWISDSNENQGETVVDIGTYTGHRVPTFTKVRFTNATVNGNYLGFDSPTRYNTLNGGDLLIKSSALTTSGTGSTFVDEFKAAS
jgi:hypothetical protein